MDSGGFVGQRLISGWMVGNEPYNILSSGEEERVMNDWCEHMDSKKFDGELLKKIFGLEMGYCPWCSARRPEKPKEPVKLWEKMQRKYLEETRSTLHRETCERVANTAIDEVLKVVDEFQFDNDDKFLKAFQSQLKRRVEAMR